MSFLHPEFLLALAVLAIPIIVHLFNFKRFKKVVFPNVRFLKKVDLQTRSKNKLRHLIILLSRLLALTCLVMAFARPFLPADDDERKSSQHVVAIYLDNSYSMQLENEDGMLLSQAMAGAERIIDAYGRNDRFILLTNELRPEHQFLLSGEKMKEELGSITSVPESRSYSEMIERAKDALSRTSNASKHIYVFSDFQESMFDPVNLRADSILNTHLIHLEHLGQGNVYIDTAWFQSPIRSLHNPERLVVRVTNASEKEIRDLPLRLSIEGQQKSIGNISLRPFSSVDSVLTFTNPGSGWLGGKVSLSDSPITFDDALHMAYEVRDRCNITIIGDGLDRQKLERIFANDPFYEVRASNSRSLDIGSLASQDFIIMVGTEKVESGLTRTLSRFVQEGGSLCVIPSMDADRASVSELFLALEANAILEVKNKELKVTAIDLDHPLYTDVFDQIPENMDLPRVSSYLAFTSRVRSSEERLMTLQDGNPLLSSYVSGKGRSYIFSSSLSTAQSNLASHSLFVTSLLRMAELSTGQSPIYQTIGEDSPIVLKMKSDEKDKVYEISDESGSTSFIPEQRILGAETYFYDRGQVESDGVYDILSEDEVVAQVAYNYDRSESRMEFISESEVSDELERNGILDFDFIDPSSLNSRSPLIDGLAGRSLWREFLLLALLFLVIEIILLKFWRT
ncbi:MAG: hypothetical protein HKN79_02115 [Flavobacteriales bacterium]|nr:hypothetical protein [Flavobacteriales bacterium]